MLCSRASTSGLRPFTTAKPFIANHRTPMPQPRQQRGGARSTEVKTCGVGKDAVGSWLDLTSFVSASGASARTPYDELADRIGRECYMDLAGWHLYLKDVKLGDQLSLAQGLARQLGVQVDGKGCKEADVTALLGRVPIKLGQGKATLPLSDVMPAACVCDLTYICEEYARRR